MPGDLKPNTFPQTGLVERVFTPDVKEKPERIMKGIPLSDEVPSVREELRVPGMRIPAQRKKEKIVRSAFLMVSMGERSSWIKEDAVSCRLDLEGEIRFESETVASIERIEASGSEIDVSSEGHVGATQT